MKVVAHLDPWVLEGELLDRIAAAKAKDPLAPVLVVVPTTRLAEHVQRRLVERFGALIGVDVLTHRSLAERILVEGGGRPLRAAPAPLLAAVFDRVLRARSAGHLASYIEQYPGATHTVRATLTDLREAGMTPSEVSGSLTGAFAELASLYIAHEAALKRLEDAGTTDDAGLARAATPLAGTFARRFGVVLHHGAYDLTGVHVEMVRAIDATAPVVVLLPGDPVAPAGRYAAQFACDHLDGSMTRAASRAGGLLVDRLSALYDESARPDSFGGDVAAAHAQDASAELMLASYETMAAIAEGISPHETAVIARSLEGCAGAADAVLGSGDLSWTTSLGTPLRREPQIRDLLLLLGAVRDDFPRAVTSELLGASSIRWEVLAPGSAPFPGSQAETWSRAAAIVKGLPSWREQLPSWAGSVRTWDDAQEDDRERESRHATERKTDAQRIVSALESLSRRVAPEVRITAAGWADRIGAIARDLFGPTREESWSPRGVLDGILAAWRQVEHDLDAHEPLDLADALAWLEARCDETAVVLPPGGRPALLDAMQARGLTFDAVALVGLNARIFPRVVREDPFLPDERRLALARATGRRIPIKTAGQEEDRLLLAMMLGAARRRLRVSWHRLVDGGSVTSPSLALREIGRLVMGSVDVATVVKAAESRSLPAHPLTRLTAVVRNTGLISDRDAALAAALSTEVGARGDRALAALLPDLSDRIALARAVESFAPLDPSYDGRVGAEVAGAAMLSASALEQLGRCPLQFFFARILRVAEPEEEISPFEIAATERGNEVHSLLAELYRSLVDDGWFAREPTTLVTEAIARLPALWEKYAERPHAARSRDLPLLARIERSAWIPALEGFLREDLPRIASVGLRTAEFESSRTSSIPRSHPVLQARGRLDRVLITAESTIVGDYKTRGNMSEKTSVTRMLRGQVLQAAIYAELSGGARVEILGVGPEHRPDKNQKESTRYSEFEGFPSNGLRDGFRETLAVLSSLRDRGVFPLREDRHCSWCVFAAACRRAHLPTAAREDCARDDQDFRDLSLKSAKLPMLGDARSVGRRDGEDAS